MFTEQVWKTIKEIGSSEASPEWIKEICQMSLSEVERLPILAEPFVSCGHFRPAVERQTISAEYLAFLKNQTELKPRGQQWADLLAKRAYALRPFLGCDVDFVRLHYFDGAALQCLTVALNPQTHELIYYD